jgi:hypothetical protein
MRRTLLLSLGDGAPQEAEEGLAFSETSGRPHARDLERIRKARETAAES